MQEHLIILRAEISKAESDLNRTMEDNSAVLQEMDNYVCNVNKEIEQAEEKLAIAKHATQVLNDEATRRQLMLDAREFALEDKQKRFDELTLATEKNISDIVQRSKENVRKLEDSFLVLSEALEGLDVEIEDGQNLLVGINRDIANAKDDLMVHREFVKGAKTELANLFSDITDMYKEKSKIQGDIEAESHRITELYAAVESRELAQDKRESNYKILKGRLGKVLNSIYPEQNIDNLI